ncbi:MAG: nicotinate-nucleotide adenylyltransferase [Chloroflexi bacterium]|nr:nicotinate-nucleotide adenylyltransferase [Chloroflexota bacterium]
MKVGVMGGTFDPIHLGHLIVAEEARIRLSLEQVIFVPTGDPWLKAGREISPAHHRMAMVKLAISSNPFFRVSPIEIERPGPSYSVVTLEALKATFPPEAEFYFILGMDSLRDLHRWHSPERLFSLCTLVTFARPGFLHFDTASLDKISAGASRKIVLIEGPLIDISGTELRRRLAQGNSVCYWVHPEVEEYIRRHGLYQPAVARS